MKFTRKQIIDKIAHRLSVAELNKMPARPPYQVEAIRIPPHGASLMLLHSLHATGQAGQRFVSSPNGDLLIISQQETQVAEPGDWVVKDSWGKAYSCTHETFCEIYEPSVP